MRNYKKEVCKTELEHHILEKVKGFFLELKRQSEEKNKNNNINYFDHHLHQADQAIKNLSQMRSEARTIITHTIPRLKKLKEAKKNEFLKILNHLYDTFQEIVEKKKSFPIKCNDFFMEIVKYTDQFFKNLAENLRKVDSQGFCACGGKNHLAELDKRMPELIKIDYFWSNLSGFDPREGYFEVHHPPDFAEIEDELKKTVKNLLESYLPPDQNPVTYVKKETIEIPVKVPVPDRVRLAHELLFGFCRAQNLHDALSLYHEEADKNGNVHACNALGELYFSGTMIPRDIKKAMHYFEESAKARNSEGLYRKGSLYEKGLISCDNRIDKALELYEEAANLGNLDAITDLGFIYEHGIRDESNLSNFLLEPNIDLALEKYKIGAKANFPRALNNLGLLLTRSNHREGVKGENRSKAVRYFEKASNRGYVKALYNLAICYDQGIGVNKDLFKAVTLFKEAAFKGDLHSKLYFAYHSLRRALMEEDQDPQGNLSEAARLMLELTFLKPNFAEPFYYLGVLYENGLAVSQDLKSALNYYSKAAALEHPPSISKIGDFYNSGVGGLVKNKEFALKYYLKAAELKSVDAFINLGTIHEEGGYAGIERDPQKALEFYEKAAALGDARAFLNIGYMYEKGKGIEKSQEKAMEYYKLAAEFGNGEAKGILDIKDEIANGKNINFRNLRAPETGIAGDSILRSRMVVNMVKNTAKIGVKGGFNVAGKYERLVEKEKNIK